MPPDPVGFRPKGACTALARFALWKRHSEQREGSRMCDYSLMAVPNRLAQEGEELVTHRFPTGSLGLASQADIARAAMAAAPTRKSFFAMLKEFFNPPAASPVCAVCIPPGARLVVMSI